MPHGRFCCAPDLKGPVMTAVDGPPTAVFSPPRTPARPPASTPDPLCRAAAPHPHHTSSTRSTEAHDTSTRHDAHHPDDADPDAPSGADPDLERSMQALTRAASRLLAAGRAPAAAAHASIPGTPCAAAPDTGRHSPWIIHGLAWTRHEYHRVLRAFHHGHVPDEDPTSQRVSAMPPDRPEGLEALRDLTARLHNATGELLERMDHACSEARSSATRYAVGAPDGHACGAAVPSPRAPG